MLSQENPRSNILLNRKVFRGRLKETIPVKIEDKTWMQPFSEILGLDNNEFQPWKSVLVSENNRVILVEGETDKKYLEYIHSLNRKNFKIPVGTNIVSYGGKDALKNTIMLKFMFEKFDKIYITFDLDAKKELEKFMRKLGLKEYEDYVAIGINSPGADCIEGLVPESVRSSVFSENTNLVTKLTATDTSARNSAKNELKKKTLEKFCSSEDYSDDDISGFRDIFKHLNNAFK